MVHTQPVGPDDQPFLRAVYAATRAEELAAWGLEPASQEAFLSMQFMARQRSYEWQYPNLDHRVILVDGERAGELMVWRGPERIQLVDIALLPAFRGRGLGARLIGALQAEAAEVAKPLGLSVLKANDGARRLYERLGFVTDGDREPYITMVWAGVSGVSPSKNKEF